MITCRIVIRPLSAFGSEIQSDTLWGHVCWAYRERHSESALTELLASDSCFVAFSSALPHDSLPRPRFGMGRKDKNLPYNDLKRAKDVAYLPAGALSGMREGLCSFSVHRAVMDLLKAETGSKRSATAQGRRINRLRNSIDRRSGSVAQGLLFGQDEIWYAPNALLDLYAVLPDPHRFPLNELRESLRQIGVHGYGRDASAGLGKFQIDRVEENPEILHAPANATHFVSLSHGFPRPGETLVSGATNTKFGRHGANLATRNNPFKNPVVRYLPGSIFATEDQNPWGGTAHKDVSHQDGCLDGGWMVRFHFVPGKENDAI